MRILYILLLYIGLPFILARQWWRARRHPEARARMGERLGYYPFTTQQAIWVHAVSVGEVIATLPLIKALQAAYPNHPMVVTTMTVTGAARVKASLGDTVQHAYLAYDTPDACRRFLNAVQPVIGVIMETEIWPNLLAACEKRGIPVCLLNARLSEKSAAGYARVGGLTRATLQRLTAIAAAAESDAARFIALGANPSRVSVAGNIKYDLVVATAVIDKAAEWRALAGLDRFVWVAASVHDGEQKALLAAHQQLLAHYPNALLILVPRHPEQFDAMTAEASALFKTERRSTHALCSPETAVYVGDTMGELLFFYAACDAAFVGGSFIPRGGHNILEPAALAKPILSGPHVFNFETIVADFRQANAVTITEDEQALTAALLHLAGDPHYRAAEGERARALMASKRGALARQCDVVYSIVQR